MTAVTVMSSTLTTEGGRYIHAGVFSISLANALVILIMIIVFVLALVVPFPRPAEEEPVSGERP